MAVWPQTALSLGGAMERQCSQTCGLISFACEMSAFSDQYATARRNVLSRMRASCGRVRKEEKRPTDLAELAWPFLEISDAQLDLASRAPTPSHLRALVQELRTIRAEKYKILQEPISSDGGRNPTRNPATFSLRSPLNIFAAACSRG